MTRDEFEPLVAAFESRWPLLDPWDLLAPLEDIDAGLFAQALDEVSRTDHQPTAALIRRTVNSLVRAAAEAEPHAAAAGFISFEEFCRRGAPHPGWLPDVTDPDERARRARIVTGGAV